MITGGVRHFLDLIDIPKTELRGMIEAGRAMKDGRRRGEKIAHPLAGKTLAMIFDSRRPAPGSPSRWRCVSSAATPSC